jgi:hypothetical protein
MSDNRATVVITRPVDYFEIGVFVICVLYGVITLTRYQELASNAVKLYPGVGGVIFLVVLVVGGATGLVSFAFKTIKGPKLELAGLTLLVVFCLAYSLWASITVGARGIGLLLWMGILIAGPGYLTRRRLARYIHRLESIENDSRLGGKENGSHAKDDHGVDHRRFRRRRRE